MLLMGSYLCGVSRVSQINRCWHSSLSIPNVSKMVSKDVVEFKEESSSTLFLASSGSNRDLFKTSEGKKIVNGILIRSSP